MKKLFLIAFYTTFAIAKVDINSASKEELMSVTGIGEVKAEAILEYRKRKCFDSVSELRQVRGFGVKSVEKIRDELQARPCKKKIASEQNISTQYELDR